jgi:hypothetical protein
VRAPAARISGVSRSDEYRRRAASHHSFQLLCLYEFFVGQIRCPFHRPFLQFTVLLIAAGIP